MGNFIIGSLPTNLSLKYLFLYICEYTWASFKMVCPWRNFIISPSMKCKEPCEFGASLPYNTQIQAQIMRLCHCIYDVWNEISFLINLSNQWIHVYFNSLLYDFLWQIFLSWPTLNYMFSSLFRVVYSIRFLSYL